LPNESDSADERKDCTKKFDDYIAAQGTGI
jgi:hypothetical protein